LTAHRSPRRISAEETVTRFIAAIEAMDIDAAVAMAADGISHENVPIQPVVGRDGLEQMLREFLGPVSEVDWQITRQWSVGQVVINERLDRFRIGDGWLELPVAGFFEVDPDGLITRWRDYFDLNTYMSRLAELTAENDA
jgi:limonene-1,2-epoxide hydrolase